jgi:tetratricopeptide (TPR) repeat protein
MGSIIHGFEYDIFISYRHKDDKYDGWVSDFVQNLKRELEATFKEDICIYFDSNPHDGLLETHDVIKSLEEKLKCVIFIPIISQTYCDPKSFAWQHELVAFNKSAKEDQLGRDIKLNNGNVASRILPIKIHNLDAEDKALLENELGGVLRGVEFIYKESGVNRPLKPSDSKHDNQDKTDYRNQVNKVANSIKEIVTSIKSPSPRSSQALRSETASVKSGKTKRPVFTILISLLLFGTVGYFFYSKVFRSTQKENRIDKSSAAKPANESAYKQLLRAKYFLNLSDNSSQIDSTIACLEASIKSDPKFALTHAMLSQAYTRKLFYDDPAGPWGERAFEESETSLALDSSLAYGYFARGFARWTPLHKFPHDECIREYKKAIMLDPSFDEAYNQLALVLAHVGLTEESQKLFMKCILLNPNNEVAKSNLSRAYFFNQEHEKVVQAFRKIPPLLYNISYRLSQQAISLIHLSEFDKAELIINEILKKRPKDIPMNAVLAVLKAKKKDEEGALQSIRIAEQGATNSKGHFHHVAYDIGSAYALLGNKVKALYWLNWAVENGFPCYTSFSEDTFLKDLKGDAPFDQLLKELRSVQKEMKRIYQE